MMDRNRTAYLDEAGELLTAMEGTLLELERQPRDAELIGTVFRQMHTLKGSGAMFGFDTVAAFTHQVESVYERVRAGSIAVTSELIQLTLQARDHIGALLGDEVAALASGAGDAVLRGFAQLSADPANGAGVSAAAPVAAAPIAAATWRIRFRPAPGAFQNGSNLPALLDELRGLGPCSVHAQVNLVPNLDTLDADRCYLYWDIVLTTEAGENTIRDVFIFVDEPEAAISIVKLAESDDGGPEHRRIGEILEERGDAHPDEITAALEARPRLGELLVERASVDPGAVRSALKEQEHLKKVREQTARAESNSLRVDSQKIDELVNLVGELVTMQARLSQLAGALEDPEVLFVAEEVERLTSLLRDTAMGIRMVPIGTSFNHFRRLVRDLSRDLGKGVELVTSGGETELDKTVIDRLGDALMHMIRNAVDHGIESAAERTALGKPPAATIRLSAIHSGAHVLIRVEDDGAGLDPVKIHAKAVQSGLIPEGAQLTEKELFALILKPGFSTSASVSGVSGRGVGMDVVARTIASLHGMLEIHSTKGRGTAFLLKLPLTLAIIDGMLVTVGDQYFIAPQSNVIECVELPREAGPRHTGRSLIPVRGEMVPYIRLREFFGISGAEPEISQIIIVETELGKLGLAVDRVIGDHQTVIKPLSRMYRQVEFMSGATLLGDGTVALIMDIEKLVRDAVMAQTR